ncbi:MAG: glycerol-3-phosphate 1-O-acyltransferase PlsY [Firmicutes bacterium]|nr:glycerol-3-phosphate 1-O-acyltransferase PlsY [Bacillota bacterium]
MGKLIILILVSYLLGNISTSYILGRIIEKKDIRNHGSKNAGATNALRVFGVKLAASTFLGDALKGVVAVIIGNYILGSSGMLIGAIFAVIGHNWPAFLKFKGGKGIATTIGVVLAINPLLAIISIIIGLIIIIKTKYVSLGSIIAMGILPLLGLIVVRPFDKKFLIFTLILSIMAIYRHKTNIERLVKGSESKIGEKA